MRYSIPLFIGGIGCALEVYPVPHLYVIRSEWGSLTDAQRLASDWYRVGHALYSALDKTNAEHAVGKAEETADIR
jgi:hypothetical protein